MIENLYFLNQNWLWPILLCGLVLWVLFLWKEWPSKLDGRFLANGMVSLIALTALALMALKPISLRTVENNAAVLLTHYYSQERLDSLRNTYENLKIVPYQMNKGIGEVLDTLSPLFVLGDGIRPFDFWQFDSVPATYLGSRTPDGIIALKYERETTVGEKLSVRGRFNSPKKGHRLVLGGPGGTGLDSVIFGASDQENFKLSTEMKVAGSYTYALIEKDSTGKAFSNEPLPVTVVPKKSLRILMVNSFPTFESKYLKNYLAKMGHQLTVRSRLTKGKYRFEYFNTGRKPIYAFLQKNLEDFDLLIIDADGYLNLSEKSENALSKEIMQDGLGVFVQPDKGFFALSQDKIGFAFVREGSRETNLKEWPKLKVDTYPFRFKNEFGLEEIHSNDKKIITAYRRKQNGRIGTTAIQDTYQWILDGHATSYQEFWSEIIGTLSKKETIATKWYGKNGFAFRHMPYSFDIRAASERPEVIGINGEEYPIIQHSDVPEVWSGTVYPRKTGWNELRIQKDSNSIHHFYVMDSTKLQALTRHRIQSENNRFFNGSSSIFQERKIPKQLSGIWFFLIFLASLAWLWLSPKIMRDS